jgi:hypothetical protein
VAVVFHYGGTLPAFQARFITHLLPDYYPIKPDSFTIFSEIFQDFFASCHAIFF